MKIKLKSNKKYKSRGLLILLMVFLILNLVGCSNKMSEDDIEKYEKQESLIYTESTNINNMLYNILNYPKIIEKVLDEEDNVEEYENKLNSVSLKGLKKYHNYMVEYKGTTQEEEDVKFNKVKYKYLLAKRDLAYTEELLGLYENDTLSDEVESRIYDIKFLYENSITQDSEVGQEILDLQKELDKKYDIDSSEIYDLESRLQESGVIIKKE